MSPIALDVLCEALGLSAEVVNELHESAELLPVIFARALLQQKPAAPVCDEKRQLLEAIHRGWGGQPFTASALIAWCEPAATPQQREVLSAARAVCGVHDGGALHPTGLGMRLRALAKLYSGAVRLERVGDVRGSQQWCVRDSRD